MNMQDEDEHELASTMHNGEEQNNASAFPNLQPPVSHAVSSFPNQQNTNPSILDEYSQHSPPEITNPSVFHDKDDASKKIHLGILLPVPNHLDTFKLHYRYKKNIVDYWQVYLSDSGIDVSAFCLNAFNTILTRIR